MSWISDEDYNKLIDKLEQAEKTHPRLIGRIDKLYSDMATLDDALNGDDNGNPPLKSLGMASRKVEGRVPERSTRIRVMINAKPLIRQKRMPKPKSVVRMSPMRKPIINQRTQRKYRLTEVKTPTNQGFSLKKPNIKTKSRRPQRTRQVVPGLMRFKPHVVRATQRTVEGKLGGEVVLSKPSLNHAENVKFDVYKHIVDVSDQKPNVLTASYKPIRANKRIVESVRKPLISTVTEPKVNSAVENVDFMKPNIEKADTKIRSEFTMIEVKKPHITRKRTQWKGVKRYRTFVFEGNKVAGYVRRSLLRHKPMLETNDFSKVLERAYRSLTHLTFSENKPFIELVRTQSVALNDALFDAFMQYGKKLFKEYARTDAMYDAWYEAHGDGHFEDFLYSEFEPTVIAFTSLKEKLRNFIEDSWNDYNQKARRARQERHGMNLKEEDVETRARDTNWHD